MFDRRWAVLAGVSFGWLLHIGIRLAIPALLPYFRAVFQFDLSFAGLLITLLWLAYAVGQIPGGMLGDRLGERNVLAGSTVLALMTLFLVGVSITRWWFFAATVGFGFATGLFATSRFTVLTDVYPESSGTAIGISSGIGNVGSMVIPIVAVFVASTAGWQFGVTFVLPFFVLAALGLWLAVPPGTSGSRPTTASPLAQMARSVGTVFRPTVLPVVLSMFCMNFVFQAFTGFYPTYLVEVKGTTEQTAGLLYGLFFGSATVVQPLVGVVGDRYGSKRTIVLLVAVLVVSLVSLPFGTDFVHFLALSVLLSVQMGFWPLAIVVLVDLLPEETQGNALGMARTTYLVLGSLGPLVVGQVSAVGFFDETFFLLGGVAVLALLSMAASSATS